MHFTLLISTIFGMKFPIKGFSSSYIPASVLTLISQFVNYSSFSSSYIFQLLYFSVTHYLLHYPILISSCPCLNLRVLLQIVFRNRIINLKAFNYGLIICIYISILAAYEQVIFFSGSYENKFYVYFQKPFINFWFWIFHNRLF